MHIKDYIIAEEPLLICTQKDKYNAAGHFQLGVVQCHLGKFAEAAASFHQCEVAMRGNNRIDFKQLNMDAKLYLSDVIFNMGLVYLFCGDPDTAVKLFTKADALEHDSVYNRVDAALVAMTKKDYHFFGESITYRMYKMPPKAIFTPSPGQVEGVKGDKSLKMMESEVVQALNDEYEFTGFVGAEKLKREHEIDDSPQNQSSVKMRKPPTPKPPAPKGLPPVRVISKGWAPSLLLLGNKGFSSQSRESPKDVPQRPPPGVPSPFKKKVHRYSPSLPTGPPPPPPTQKKISPPIPPKGELPSRPPPIPPKDEVLGKSPLKNPPMPKNPPPKTRPPPPSFRPPPLRK